MSTDIPAAVLAALQNLPEFAEISPSAISAERLGGLTNRVYRISNGQQRLIVRIPGDGTEAYINRAVELHNARAAARAGVSAPFLWADAETGVMITRCIDDAVTMTADLFARRAGAPARAGRALAALHRSGEAFEFRFELFAMIADYLALLDEKQATLPDGYADVVAAAEPIKQLLESHPAPPAPCHCDPLCENFLDDGKRLWIVDWEYSGMNDPMWDLGDLSIEAGLDRARELEMLTAYFNRPPTSAEHARVVIYKAMCDLLWTLWGLIQHADDNPAEDFWAYAMGRLGRCAALMQSAEFADHLRALKNG